MAPITKMAGSTLIEEEPFAYVVNEERANVICDNCMTYSARLIPCSGCGKFNYCDEACRAARLANFHAWECPRLKRTDMSVFRINRLTVMVLYTLKLGKSEQKTKSDYLPKLCRSFGDLRANNRRSSDDLKEIQSIWDYVKKICLDPKTGVMDLKITKETVADIYWKMQVNVREIHDEFNNTQGFGVYVASSSITHSCKPNSAAIFEGCKLRVVTIEDIPSFTIGKATVDFVGGYRTRAERKQLLLKNFHFDCRCRRCKEVEELGKHESMLCPRAACRKMIPMTDKAARKLKCVHCHRRICHDTIVNYWKMAETSCMLYDQDTPNRNNVLLKVAEEALSLLENEVPPSSLYRMKLLHVAQYSAMKLKDEEMALKYIKLLLPEARLYFGKNSPVVCSLAIKAAKCESQADVDLSSPHEAAFSVLFLEALRIASLTYGRESKFYSMIVALVENPILLLCLTKGTH